MNNVVKKNSLLLSLLSTVCFVASCGSTPTSSSLPNSETSSEATSENDSWIWWDDVEGGDEDDEPLVQYNTIDYLKDYVSYFSSTDSSETKTFDPSLGAQRYEAELCAELTGKAQVEEETHVGYLQEDATATFTITSTAACKVVLAGNLSTKPANTDGVWFDSQFYLEVNNEFVDTGDCWMVPTLSWTIFKINPIAAIELVEGENVIKFTGLSGLANIDYIVLAPEKKGIGVEVSSFTYAKDLKIEAEDCLLNDCEVEEDETMSNGKNVGYTTPNTTLEFIINTTEATKTTLSVNAVICVSSVYSGKINERFAIYLNGKNVDVSTEVLPDTDESVNRWWLHDYSDIQIGDIELKEGENHIILRVSKELNLDYITLS